MKKKNKYFKVAFWVVVCAFILTGCSKNHSTDEKIFMENEKEEPEEEKIEEAEAETSSDFIEADTEYSTESIVIEPEIVDADWSEYFNGLNGEAVVYDISDRRYECIQPKGKGNSNSNCVGLLWSVTICNERKIIMKKKIKLLFAKN